MEEYREMYLMEAEEMLHIMEQELLRLEQGSSDEAIQSLFRAAHTLKGSSAAMGYIQTNRLTHEMEHVLEKVRTRVWEVTPDLATLLFRCVDRIRLLQQEEAEANQERSAIDDLLASLRRYGGPAPSEARLPVTVRLQAEDARLARLRLEAGDRLFHVSVTLSEECEMPEARLVVIEGNLADKATLLITEHFVELSTNKIDYQETAAWLIAGSMDQNLLADEVGAWIDVAEVRINECAIAEEQAVSVASSAPSVTEDTSRKARGASSTIRVNVERVENLMNLVGELVIEQTRFAQVTKELERSLPSNPLVQDMGQIEDRFNRVLGDLHENVMKVRMLPIEQLFSRFPRMIRDLSHALGKEVELVLEGQDTELDRTLIEELGDPLIHLIRNALDHGFEKPQDRLQAGKPSAGRLRIGAYHEDNHVLIQVEDDGAGIDISRLLQKAVDRGIMTPEEAASRSDRGAVDLIFHPGLSTASAVSDVSGRGVGMDIVRDCIEKVNGMIDVETEPGKGTCFKLRLPLTLAIGTGLLVVVADRTYIVPMSNVTEIVRMEPEAIQAVKGMPVVNIRNRIIPVVWLHDLFGHPKLVHRNRHIPMVIIGRGDQKIAMAVEQLIGNQEIVIKPLGAFVGQVEGIAGATILGSGKVALILEIGSLIKRFGRS